jgi:hypothetical protein
VHNGSSKLLRNYYEPLLEIRSIAQSPKLDDSSTKETRGESKNALDYMPKYVLKQINERRMLSSNILNNPNGTIVSSGNITTVMTPYGLYNSRDSSQYIETMLNRKSSRSSRLQSQIFQNSLEQQQQSRTLNTTPPIQQQQRLASSLINTKFNDEGDSAAASNLFASTFINSNQKTNQLDRLSSKPTTNNNSMVLIKQKK